MFNREKIYEIIFLNFGIVKQSKKFDYYDLIQPGVSILFGENKNYIIYYNNSNTIESSQIEEISNTEDYLIVLTKFFVKQYNFKDLTLVEGLLKCIIEEDEDGLYDYCKEQGGAVFFKNPNSLIELENNIFVVKQKVECDFYVHKLNLFFNDDSLRLEELNSGYFDLYNEQVVYWKK